MLCSVTQSCPILCNSMDVNPPGSFVPGSFQARTLEQVAISFSRASSRLRDRTCVSCIAFIFSPLSMMLVLGIFVLISFVKLRKVSFISSLLRLVLFFFNHEWMFNFVESFFWYLLR